MKRIVQTMMILCGAVALAVMPACTSTDTSKPACTKCGSATCTSKCDTAAPKACPKCGKAGCTSCKM